jgi:CHAT domain-containing protein
VLAVGDPEYTIEAEGRSIQVYAEGRPLDPLPATRHEVLTITSKQDVRLLGVHATAADLVEMAATRARWEVIHLACHGLINTDTPSLSALALTPHGGDDGFLTALEVHNMRLRADLVVLSGCNTGRGKYMKGEGLVGLMRAFLSAGAPRVLVSLWKVDDKATQALMTRFHQLWRKEGWSSARALRQAQSEIRSRPEWRHPRYWGAWVLWGLVD